MGRYLRRRGWAWPPPAGSLWLARLFGISDPAVRFCRAEYSSLDAVPPAGPRPGQIRRFWNEAVRIVDPLARYAGSLQCWNWSDFREAGGVPSGQLVLWPDRLEMSGRGVFRAVFRPRTILRERVQLVRLLLPLNPVHQVISAVHPLARGRQYVNFVVSAPTEQRVDTGDIHYVLGIRSADATDLLDLFDGAGFPVSRAAVRLTKVSIGPELSWLDFKNRPGRP